MSAAPSNRVIFECGGGRIAMDACPMSWSALTPTANARKRHCDACKKPVFLVANAIEAALRHTQGECIAVPPSVAENARAESVYIVGQINWVRRFSGVETED